MNLNTFILLYVYDLSSARRDIPGERRKDSDFSPIFCDIHYLRATIPFRARDKPSKRI